MTSLQIAIAQMQSIDSVMENLRQIEIFMEQAVKQGAKVLFLPENCLYMRLDKKQLPPYLSLKSPEILRLASLAKSLSLAVHLGGVGIEQGGKHWNASLWIDQQGHVQHTYSKQRLFDIDLGQEHSYRESDVYDFGQSNRILEFAGFRFGQSICFDLRFAEIYTEYARAGVDVLLIPSSFLVPTGRAHWHVLNRARAIENQAYVVAAAQCGDHLGRHQSFGHSLVVDPWGDVLLDLGHQVNSVASLSLDLVRVKEVRRKMPMRAQT